MTFIIIKIQSLSLETNWSNKMIILYPFLFYISLLTFHVQLYVSHIHSFRYTRLFLAFSLISVTEKMHSFNNQFIFASYNWNIFYKRIVEPTNLKNIKFWIFQENFQLSAGPHSLQNCVCMWLIKKWPIKKHDQTKDFTYIHKKLHILKRFTKLKT